MLRLLRGEDLETVSRVLGVTAAPLTSWRDAFLSSGEEAALRTRQENGEALENDRLKARLGEVMIERDPAARQDRHPGGWTPFGPAEAAAMSRTVSPVAGQRYGLAAAAARAAAAPELGEDAPSRPGSDDPEAGVSMPREGEGAGVEFW